MTNHTASYTLTSGYGGDEVEVKALKDGDLIKDFRGNLWTFQEVSRGPQPGRSAKVVVRDEIGTREFYSTVFPGLEVI